MDFLICVENARRTEWNSGRAHCPVAFNNYIHWFLGSTRVSICPPSYEEEILEEPVQFDELAYTQYNRQVRKGTDIPLSSSLNFAVKLSLPSHYFPCTLISFLPNMFLFLTL